MSGKCRMSERSDSTQDGCYARFGKDKTACESGERAQEHCEWRAGKCKVRVTRGVLNLELETTETFPMSNDILAIVRESEDILSRAIHGAYGFSSVRIMDMSIARRLRAGSVTKVNVEFEGQGMQNKNVRPDAAAAYVQTTLQIYYEKQGIELKVHSTSVEFLEPQMHSEQSRTNDAETEAATSIGVYMGIAAGGLLCVTIMVATFVFLGCKAKKAKAVEANLVNAAQAQQMPNKDNDFQNDDFAEVSTGTPDTDEKSINLNQDMSNVML